MWKVFNGQMFDVPPFYFESKDTLSSIGHIRSVDKKLAFVKMSVYELLLELFGRWTDSEH
jgi:hypothetical protein